jgi:hypothetical protein
METSKEYLKSNEPDLSKGSINDNDWLAKKGSLNGNPSNATSPEPLRPTEPPLNG